MPKRVLAGLKEKPTGSYSKLSKEGQKVIDDFVASLGVLSEARQRKYRNYLGKISWELAKPFEEVSMADLRSYIVSVNADEYTDQTRRDIRLISKKFFKWLRNDEFVSWIKLGHIKPTVRAEDLLEDWELDNLRTACKNVRNKALIETLYEGAFRPHEFLSLRKNDVMFDEYGAVVLLPKGKTGSRRVRLVNASRLLANWIENHPIRDRDAPLAEREDAGQPPRVVTNTCDVQYYSHRTIRRARDKDLGSRGRDYASTDIEQVLGTVGPIDNI